MCGVVLTAVLLAQAPPVFGVGVEEVRVDVSVTSKGAPVRGLAARDFVLKDNGVLQDVEVVDRAAVPTTVVLALDRSTSVSGRKLELLRAAATAFLRGLRPQDEAALLAFDHRVELLCAATTDRVAVTTAIAGLQAGGASSVVDALYLALKGRWGTGLPLVLLFTDGEDSASWLDNDDVLRAVRESPALLHVVGTEGRGLHLRSSTQGAGYAPRLTESGYANLLRRAAETTGGEYWTVASAERLESAFARVLENAGARYVLRYEPHGVTRLGLHRLDVSVRRRSVTVRARREYLILK